jgi:hypothetical protein
MSPSQHRFASKSFRSANISRPLGKKITEDQKQINLLSVKNISTGNEGSQTSEKPVFHVEILPKFVSAVADFAAEKYIS